MYVNVDWFFLSHRLVIAQNALKNYINMSVFTDFTKSHILTNYSGFMLRQSSIRRVNRSLIFLLIEFTSSFFRVVKESPNLIHAVTIKPILFLGIISRILNIPFVGSITGLGPAFSSTCFRTTLRLEIIILIYKFIFSSRESYIICQSIHDRDTLIQRNITSKRQIILIPGSGVDLVKYSPFKNKFYIKPYVFMASRILYDKGVVEFCNAARLVNTHMCEKIDFKLAGPIDNRSPSSMPLYEVEQLCSSNGVEYLGNVDCINELLVSARLFVYPSFYPEGIPKVLLEASACGVPIVTTDHPGCRDAIIVNETGVLVKPYDCNDLANKIVSLLNNPDISRQMGLRGRSLAEELYGDELVVDTHYKLYSNMLHN